MFAASKTAAAAAGTPPPSTDPQFNYVTMLLHGDGTNGAQNNTFVDSSTNNFTITRNGTPTQGSFSPYGDLWSNLFSGTSQYLTTGSISALSGDFTIEAWVYLNSTGQNDSNFLINTAAGGLSFSLYSSGSRMSFGATNVAYDVISTNGIPTFQWVHLAVTRSGTTLRIFINGVNDGTSTQSRTYIAGSLNVGGNSGISSRTINGYMSNVRIVNGTALYTSAFTPPTTPLTAVSGTSLLTCQSNRFRDNSSNNFAITVTGTPSVQRFSPFDPAAEYSTSVIGGSAGVFNGSNTWLTAPAGSAFAYGTGDFTVEGWFYATAALPAYSANIFAQSVSGTNYFLCGLGDNQATPANKVSFIFATSGGGTVVTNGSATYTNNTWNHFAIVRSSGVVTVYLNGVGGTPTTCTQDFSNTTYVPTIARYTHTSSNMFTGYLSNNRVVKGTAVYTSNFTPPTAPLTAITNTSLLLNTVNAGIFDNAMMNDLVTVGNAQVSTAVKKYGTGSMAFDGSGDWLTFIDTPNVQLGTGDFTVEGWLYISTTGTAKYIAAKGTSTTGWALGVNSSNQLVFNYTSSTLTGSTALSSGQWYHVAVVRSGTATGNIKIYLGGTADVTSGGAINDNFNQINAGYVGADRTGANAMNGYIDDLRITKGYARYTANFTPPTAALPNN